MRLDNYKGHNLVLIVGSPRSGTTWLQRLLACHPSVRTGQESYLFDCYIGPQVRAWRLHLDLANGGRNAIGFGCYLREEEFFALLREYMVKLLTPMVGNLQRGEIFLEKTPSHALFIPEIRELLPESRIIHILRDPRDVVASILAASRTWGVHWAPRSASEAAQMWVEYVIPARQASRDLPKDKFFEVRYEDLHSDTARTLRTIAEFLDLKWNDQSLLEAVEKNTLEATKANGGTAIPVGGEFAKSCGVFVKLDAPGFVRKARPGVWREDLTSVERIRTWRFLRSIMKEVGYSWTFPSVCERVLMVADWMRSFVRKKMITIGL